MEKVYSTPFRNYIQRNGFVMVSNLLLDYQQELGISEKELSFIIKVMKNRPGYVIKDADLDPTVCSKTLSRRRSSLKEKGLLNFSIIKKQNDEGCFATIGISYDLSPLEAKLQQISDEIENSKQTEIKEVLEEEKCVVEATESSPLEKFQNDWKNYYGKKYNISKVELEKYNGLSSYEKEYIADIFDYFNENNLFEKGFNPRLSFFFNVNWRFIELKNYHESLKENDYEDFEDMFKEIDEEKIREYVNEEYFEHYDNLKQNKNYYKALERLVGRYYKDGELPNIKVLLDKAYRDNLKFEFKQE